LKTVDWVLIYSLSILPTPTAHAPFLAGDYCKSTQPKSASLHVSIGGTETWGVLKMEGSTWMVAELLSAA
jgi:hypothetical protein